MIVGLESGVGIIGWSSLGAHNDAIGVDRQSFVDELGLPLDHCATMSTVSAGSGEVEGDIVVDSRC